MPNSELRRQVINVYKVLLHLGKDYPQGENYFRRRLHAAFAANAGLRDEDAIRRGIARAQYVQKALIFDYSVNCSQLTLTVAEIEALYYLKRYRTLRKRYDGD